MNRFAYLVAPILLSAASSAFAAVQYTVVDLGTLGGQSSYATAINASGQVVGRSDGGRNVGEHAFLYSDGVMKDLGETNEAWGLNDAGAVVGDFTSSVRGDIHAFLYDDSGMTDLTQSGWVGVGRAINSSGTIVGSTALDTSLSEAPALYSNGSWTMLGTLGGSSGVAAAINEGGQIAGSAETSTHHIHAFLYQQGSMIDLGTLGGTTSWAFGINNAGAVVGWSIGAGDAFEHAFLYENGQIQDLGVLSGGNESAAYAINNKSVIVGESNAHAAIWTNRTISDLNQMIPLDFSIYLTNAMGINDSGEIICNGFVNGQAHAFLLVPGVTPPALGVQGRLHRVNTRRHAMIQGITTNGPVKNVTFHVGRVMPGHGTASHSGGIKVEHPRYANGTSSWSLATALKPGRNYVTITAHGSYGDSRPITVEIIQK